MDRIEITGLRALGHHGVSEPERRDGQTFLLDVGLELDLSGAAATDDLAATVDYGSLAARLADEVATTRFDLIEALASHLADVVLTATPARAVSVRVAKPDAPMTVDVDQVAVTLRRERETSGAPAGAWAGGFAE
ncbi:dihydroneopterin aldolase [soil metagenome]